MSLEQLMTGFAAAMAGVTGPTDIGRRVGAFALGTPTVAESERLAAVEARLPRKQWPERTMLIPAADAVSGETTVFTRDSGVPLLDAVAASCAPAGAPQPWGSLDEEIAMLAPGEAFVISAEPRSGC